MDCLKRFKKLITPSINPDEPKEFSHFRPEDEDLITDNKAAFLGKPTLLSSSILYLIILLVIIALIWSYFGILDQSTVGEGKVISISEDKIIQSMDGGIIKEILVREGDIVVPGQILVTLDKTRYKSEYNAYYEKYLALSATVARLTAEAEKQDHIEFPAFILNDRPELAERERSLFEARRHAFQVEIANLQEIVNTSKKEVTMYEPLLKDHYVSDLQYLNAVRIAAQAQQTLLEKKSRFEETIWIDLNKNKAEVEIVRNNLNESQDKITHTTIRSPVYGMVKKIHVATVGGVISSGMDIMDIVPLADSLLIQVKVKPKDIAFIHVGAPATVKITAYDYTIYGSLTGTVVYVSPNIIEDKPSSQHPDASGNAFYLVNVSTSKSYFGNEKHKLPIIPGMTATAQIQTGKKRILDYLLKPLLKAKEEALRER